MMDKPDVDTIEGLSPAIAIEQKATSHNPRSTVGTVTEVYDYLRLLFARAGTPRCPDHGIDLTAQTVSQMVDQVLKLPEDTPVALLAPLISDRKGEHGQVFEDLSRRASCGCASMATCTNSMRGRIWTPSANTASRRSWIGSKCGPTVPCGWLSHLKPRCASRAGSPIYLLPGSTLSAPTRGVLQPARLPGVRIQRAALGTEAVFLQQPGRRLPDLRRTGRQTVLRSAARGRQGSLSLATGAVRGRDRNNAHYMEIVNPSRATMVSTSRLPGRSCRRKSARCCWKAVAVSRSSFGSGRSMATVEEAPYVEGFLPYLERRYRETQSPRVREELTKYLGTQACPECAGTRLNRTARFVFVGDYTPAADRASVGG